MTPLLSEDFSGDVASAWTADVGAWTGKRPQDGPESAWAVEDGAVVLRATADDRRFVSLDREVAVPADVHAVRVSVRMKTDGVDGSTARFRNCDVWVRAGGVLQAVALLDGTNDWATYDRVVTVPKGATKVQVGLFLTMPGAAWFDDLVVEPYDQSQLWTGTAKQGHYTYHWLAGDDVPQDARDANDAAYHATAAWFGMPEDIDLDYYKYPDNATKGQMTGDAGNAHWDGALHDVWPVDDHEIVHAFAHRWGEPPPLLAEGLAVYVGGDDWNGTPTRDAARGEVEAHGWVPVEALLSTSAFRLMDDRATYPLAGAFVKYLIETYGKERFHQLYSALPSSADPAGARREVRRALHVSVDRLDGDFRAWLLADRSQPPG